MRRSPGDQSAWDEFVGRYGPRIVGWCRRWGLQEADAQDVSQAVLIRLAVKLRTFVYDPSRSFRAWLRHLTRHAWSDFLAETRRSAVPTEANPDMDRLQTLEARDDLERRLAEAFDLELLELAKARVRSRVEPRTWRAFELTTIEGLSGVDAAEQIGMRSSAVFMAKSNVKRMIREEIDLLDRDGP